MCYHFFSTGETARRSFENLRKRYNKAKGRYHIKGPLDLKERLSMERDVASYSFISWLDPYIHRRQAKYKLGSSNDDAFDASMVNREGPAVLEISNNTQDDGMMQTLCFDDPSMADGNDGMKNENHSESEMDGDEDEEDYDDEQERKENRENDKNIVASANPVSPPPSTVSGSLVNVAKSDIVEVLPNNNSLNFPPITPSSAIVKPGMPISDNNDDTPTNEFPAPSFIMGNVLKTKSSEIAFVPQAIPQQSRKTVSAKLRPAHSLPKVSSYMSIRSPYTNAHNRNSKYNRLMEKYSSSATTTNSPKRFAVADSTKSSSTAKVPRMNHGNQQGRIGTTSIVTPQSMSDLSSNTDEASLLVRLIKTKMDKLPERLKLSCQNELLQTVLKYELMAVDEKTKAQEKATLSSEMSKDCRPPKHQDIVVTTVTEDDIDDENQVVDSSESTVASSSADL